MQISTLQDLLPSLEPLARDSGLIRRRSRKFSAAGFLLALLKATCSGQATLCALASTMGDCGLATMTRQSMWERISPRSVAFLRAVLDTLLQSRVRAAIGEELRSQLPFDRVLVEDSTTLPMGPGNRGDFRGGGGGGGGKKSAGCKVRLVAELLTGEILAVGQYAGATPDQSTRDEVLGTCRPGDLLLRDMGYFGISTLAQLGGRQVGWLSRLPAGTSARREDGKPLLELLVEAGDGPVDCQMVIGRGGRGQEVRCRLIASRLPQEAAAGNRRRRAAKSRGEGKKPSEEARVRAGWTILVTNLPAGQISTGVALELYTLRWSIEITFRAIKGATHTGRALRRGRRKGHQETLLLAAQIFSLLGLREWRALHRRAVKKNRGASPEKTLKRYAGYLLSLAGAPREWGVFRPDMRHVLMDRRRRESLDSKGHSLLT